MSVSVQLETACASCGRPSYLWGGNTCDVCDADNSGMNDASELPTYISSPSASILFPPTNEKGWILTSPAFVQDKATIRLRAMLEHQRRKLHEEVRRAGALLPRWLKETFIPAG